MTFGALGGFLRTPKNPPGYGPVRGGNRVSQKVADSTCNKNFDGEFGEL